MNKSGNEGSKYTKLQRIMALIGVILLVCLFLCALIFSLIKTEWAPAAAKGCIGCALVVPILIWVNLWLFGKVFHKHTIADLDIAGVPTSHDPAITLDISKIADNKESGEKEN
ncbi:MAG: hypothetical protein J6X36_04330 [Lachnospiraceae bacterium]|nr:hypothetical protein [Lachnospiraceae bacterium]